jgi:hypothetical protein
VYPFGVGLHFTDDRAGHDSSLAAGEVLAYLEREGFKDVQVKPIAAGIEDRFMDLMPAVQRAS